MHVQSNPDQLLGSDDKELEQLDDISRDDSSGLSTPPLPTHFPDLQNVCNDHEDQY